MSSSFKQHLERLTKVFERLRSANLKLKPLKCKLLQLKVKFLGSVVSGDGIEPDPEKIAAVVDWPVPMNLTDVRSFTGLAKYYRRHIQGFDHVAKQLFDLMKKGVSFYWSDEQQQAFETLKSKLVNYPILAPPLLQGGGYVVDTDASNYAAGAVLQQNQDGQLRVIAYASRAFNKAERQYCTTRKE
jgi:hypothetical protein